MTHHLFCPLDESALFPLTCSYIFPPQQHVGKYDHLQTSSQCILTTDVLNRIILCCGDLLVYCTWPPPTRWR